MLSCFMHLRVKDIALDRLGVRDISCTVIIIIVSFVFLYIIEYYRVL